MCHHQSVLCHFYFIDTAYQIGRNQLHYIGDGELFHKNSNDVCLPTLSQSILGLTFCPRKLVAITDTYIFLFRPFIPVTLSANVTSFYWLDCLYFVYTSNGSLRFFFSAMWWFCFNAHWPLLLKIRAPMAKHSLARTQLQVLDKIKKILSKLICNFCLCKYKHNTIKQHKYNLSPFIGGLLSKCLQIKYTSPGCSLQTYNSISTSVLTNDQIYIRASISMPITEHGPT